MKRLIIFLCVLSMIVLCFSSCGTSKEPVINLFSTDTVKADVEAQFGNPVHDTPLFVLYETTVKDQLAKVMVTYQEDKIASIRYDISFASNGGSQGAAKQLFDEIKEQVADGRKTPIETKSGDSNTGEVITYSWNENVTLSFTQAPGLEQITLEMNY